MLAPVLAKRRVLHSICVAFAAGTLLTLVLAHVLPEAQAETQYATILFILGFVAMLLLQQRFLQADPCCGHEHSDRAGLPSFLAMALCSVNDGILVHGAMADGFASPLLWAAEPQPPYASVGVAGSRDLADLLVFDPATGGRVLIELAIVDDWTTNKWIADLNSDTDRIRKAASSGVVGLQLIVAASLTSAVELNETGRAWLAMSDIWTSPTDLKRALPMGSVGQILIHGWQI